MSLSLRMKLFLTSSSGLSLALFVMSLRGDGAPTPSPLTQSLFPSLLPPGTPSTVRLGSRALPLGRRFGLLPVTQAPRNAGSGPPCLVISLGEPGVGEDKIPPTPDSNSLHYSWPGGFPKNTVLKIAHVWAGLSLPFLGVSWVEWSVPWLLFIGNHGSGQSDMACLVSACLGVLSTPAFLLYYLHRPSPLVSFLL